MKSISEKLAVSYINRLAEKNKDQCPCNNCVVLPTCFREKDPDFVLGNIPHKMCDKYEDWWEFLAMRYESFLNKTRKAIDVSGKASMLTLAVMVAHIFASLVAAM